MVLGKMRIYASPEAMTLADVIRWIEEVGVPADARHLSETLGETLPHLDGVYAVGGKHLKNSVPVSTSMAIKQAKVPKGKQKFERGSLFLVVHPDDFEAPTKADEVELRAVVIPVRMSLKELIRWIEEVSEVGDLDDLGNVVILTPMAAEDVLSVFSQTEGYMWRGTSKGLLPTPVPEDDFDQGTQVVVKFIKDDDAVEEADEEEDDDLDDDNDAVDGTPDNDTSEDSGD